MADWSLLGLPLLAGLLVLLTHVRLGDQVLRRGIVFIDLAVAQVAALGGLVGASLVHDGWRFPMALGFALVGVLLMAVLGRRYPAYQEALIGLTYVAAATLAVLWVAQDPHGAQKLAAMLSGDILWVNADAIFLLGAVTLGGVDTGTGLVSRRRLLRPVRGTGDGLGTDTGTVPCLCDAHCPGAGKSSSSARTGLGGLWFGRIRLCRRSIGIALAGLAQRRSGGSSPYPERTAVYAYAPGSRRKACRRA